MEPLPALALCWATKAPRQSEEAALKNELKTLKTLPDQSVYADRIKLLASKFDTLVSFDENIEVSLQKASVTLEQLRLKKITNKVLMKVSHLVLLFNIKLKYVFFLL